MTTCTVGITTGDTEARILALVLEHEAALTAIATGNHRRPVPAQRESE